MFVVSVDGTTWWEYSHNILLGGRVSNCDGLEFKVEKFHATNVRGLLWLISAIVSLRKVGFFLAHTNENLKTLQVDIQTSRPIAKEN